MSTAADTTAHTNTTNSVILGTATVGIRELESYDSCKIWLEGYNSPATKKAYKTHLLSFCKHHNNIDPDSLIQIQHYIIESMATDFVTPLMIIGGKIADYFLKKHEQKDAMQSISRHDVGEFISRPLHAALVKVDTRMLELFFRDLIRV
jgi:hypothetical protein